MISPNCLHHIKIGIELGYIREAELKSAIKKHQTLCIQGQTQRIIISLLNLNQITSWQAKQILIHQAQTTFTVKSRKQKELSHSAQALTKRLTELDKKYNFIFKLNKNYCLKLDLYRWANEAKLTLSSTRDKKALLDELKLLIGRQIKEEYNEVSDLVRHYL